MSEPSEPAPLRGIVELARSDCVELLSVTAIGRVVVLAEAARIPIIRPVNYVFDPASQSVVFRSAPGSKLYSLVHSSRAWFEIDSFDPPTRTGWSVIIGGVTEEITRGPEIKRLRELGLEPWAPGERAHWVRIRARTVSGRRIVAVGADNAEGQTSADP